MQGTGRSAFFSLLSSLSCFCSFAHVLFQLGHAFRQIIVLEQNGRSHNMFSSASDDLTSAYAGSEWLGRHLQLRLRLQFSFTSAVRTLRRQLRGRQVSKPGGDDPDSAELSNVFDHESCPSGSDDSASQAVSCQGERHHQRNADSG